MSIKIKFQGTEYWFMGDSFEEVHGIAPLYHCHEDGTLNLDTAFTGDSFAHWIPKKGMMRYGEVIGQLSDIEIVK